MTRQVFTLCVVVRDNKVLLAKKQRKHGAGYWNGFGGRVEVGEAIEAAAIRECQEEVGITPTVIDKKAVFTFHYPDAPLGFDEHEVHVFVVSDFTGEIQSTDEMSTPTWFSADTIPYDQMWEDDQHWLPLILEGKSLEGDITFDVDKHIVSHDIRQVLVQV